MPPLSPSVAANDERFHELLAEYLRRTDSGEEVDQGAFISAHPEFAEALAEYFEGASVIEEMAGPKVASREPHGTVRGQLDSDTSVDFQQDATYAKGQDQTGRAAAPSAGKSQMPTAFGRYKILRELGQGAMGAVYLAEDTQLQRRVALKIPKFSGAEGVDMLERFYREARAAATLRHPNICPVYDVGEIEGQHYITMAFIEGRPLRDFAHAKKRQPEKQVAAVIRKLALGLAEAHAHGIIHRDLKPANIMVDTKGEPVVMDFGLARREVGDDKHVTRAGAILGTPAYMSPEQVEGDQSKIGPPADIYSLGVVMYELLTGQVPFAGSLMSILMQIASEQPNPPSLHRPELDPRLEAICLKMMAKKAGDRHGTMEEVAQALTGYLKAPALDPTKIRGTAAEMAQAVGEYLKSPATDPASSGCGQSEGSISASAPMLAASATGETGRVDNAHEQLTGGQSMAPEMPGSLTVAPELEVRSSGEGVFPSLSGRGQGEGTLAAQLRARSKLSRRVLFALGGALAAVVILFAGVTFYVRLGKIDLQVVVNDKSLTVKFEGESVVFDDSGKKIRVWPGEHKFVVEHNGIVAETDKFLVKKDGKNVLAVSLVDGRVIVKKDGHASLEKRVPEEQEPVELPSSSPSLASQELLKNPGCEEPLVDGKIPGWVESEGRWRSAAGGRNMKVRPYEGTAFFITAKSPRAELYQDVDVMSFASAIDSGKQQFEFKGYVRSLDQDNPDLTRVRVEYRDATNEKVLARYDSGESKNVKSWKRLSDTRLAPVETRWIRVRLTSIRSHAEANNGWFDGLSLRAVPVSKPDSSSSGWHGWPKDAPAPAIAPFDAKQAKAHQEAWAKYLGVPVEYENSLRMKFRLIPPGEFTMGSTPEEIVAALKDISPKDFPWREIVTSEAQRRKVTLTQPIYICVHEVTQSQYAKIMGQNPAHYSKTGAGKKDVRGFDTTAHPVEMVDWSNATEFCQKLSEHEREAEAGDSAEAAKRLASVADYRLLSEAQWEFACRAGTTTVFSTGDKATDLAQIGWFEGNSKGRPHAVGQLQANAFGLHDMHGNVWEWVSDLWDREFYTQNTVDPVCQASNRGRRIIRGGNCYHHASYCRSSGRHAIIPGTRHDYIGFRVALPVNAVKPAKASPETGLNEPASATDLLKLVDVNRDAVHGKWQLTADGLTSDGSVPFCRLKLPYKPPREYDFRVEFTAQGGNDILQLLTAEGRSFTWLMGAWGGRYDGFDTVQGHPLTREGTNIVGGPTKIRRGQRHTSVVKVRRDSVSAEIDGQLVVRHPTDGADLGMPREWEIGPDAIGLGTTFDAVVFHKVEIVVPELGAAKPANADRAAAEWVIEKGGSVVVVSEAPANKSVLARRIHSLPAGTIRLKTVQFDGSSFADADLERLANLADPENLQLSQTGVTDDGLRPLSRLKLKQLLLVRMPISDRGLIHLKDLHLDALSLSETLITNEGLKSLSEMTTLTWLNLAKCAINDDGLAQLHALKSLKRLYVGGTKITPAGIKAFKAAVPGCEVDDPSKPYNQGGVF
jgi:serine/threonine protein kinase/formylglycine-generating enzyme required for sulfatase activity